MVAEQCRDDDGGDAPAIRFLKYLLAGFCMLGYWTSPATRPARRFRAATWSSSRTASTTARSGRKQTM